MTGSTAIGRSLGSDHKDTQSKNVCFRPDWAILKELRLTCHPPSGSVSFQSMPFVVVGTNAAR